MKCIHHCRVIAVGKGMMKKHLASLILSNHVVDGEYTLLKLDVVATDTCFENQQLLESV